MNKSNFSLFMFADFDSRRFAYFLEREMKVTIGEYEIAGRIDGMVATGFRNPKKPFFCLNEYNAQRRKTNQPRWRPKGTNGKAPTFPLSNYIFP
jgi:hypothetical protein